MEKRTRELQAKCNELENEKYEAIVRARNSMQLLEEANLQKNQVRKLVNMFINNVIPNIPWDDLIIGESVVIKWTHNNDTAMLSINKHAIFFMVRL